MLKPHHFSLCWWRASAHDDTRAAQAPQWLRFAPTLCAGILRKSPGIWLHKGCWRGARTSSYILYLPGKTNGSGAARFNNPLTPHEPLHRMRTLLTCKIM